MPRSGCSALHGVNANLKKNVEKKIISQETYLASYIAIQVTDILKFYL